MHQSRRLRVVKFLMEPSPLAFKTLSTTFYSKTYSKFKNPRADGGLDPIDSTYNVLSGRDDLPMLSNAIADQAAGTINLIKKSPAAGTTTLGSSSASCSSSKMRRDNPFRSPGSSGCPS